MTRRFPRIGALALAAVAMLGAPAAAAAEESLTAVATDVSRYPDVRLVAAAPPALSDQTLLPSAFATPTEGTPSPRRATSTWVLVLGSALVAAALLVALAGVFVFRAPRARGLDLPRGGARLAGAARRAEAMGDTLLRRADSGSRISRALEAAGLEIRPGELVAAVATVGAVAVLLAAAAGGPPAAFAVALAVPLVAKVAIGLVAQRRRSRFADQLPGTLQMLAGSLRGGHALAQAVDTVAREAESPTSDEFRRLTIEARLGRDFRGALDAMAHRVRSTDFEWVVQAIDIQREVGGDLAEILDAVGTTIHDRNRVRRQVHALSAEGRLSAWVLMVLPFAMAAIMLVTNRSYISTLWSSSVGVLLMVAGGALLAVGALWLRCIVKPAY